jgi:signal transduction histidine kinase
MASLHARSPSNSVASPWGVGMLVLAVVSVTEYVIMLVLPELLYGEHPRLLACAVDALVLSAVLSPVLWWMVVRPLRRAAEQRERFLADLFSTIEADRRHMAHELHDGVGQSLTMIISGMRSLPEHADGEDLNRRRRDLTEVAESALQDVKRMALGLRPSLLDDLGLAPAIERLAADIQSHHALEVSVEDETIQGARFSEAVETALFRICQEALNNVVKHASARRAAVRLLREPQALVLEIQDDGAGIAPAALSQSGQRGGHLGLAGMRERATLLDGELTVHSEAGQGTRITARIPIEAPRT